MSVLNSKDDYDIHQGKPIDKNDGTLRYYLSLKNSEDSKKMCDSSMAEIHEKLLNLTNISTTEKPNFYQDSEISYVNNLGDSANVSEVIPLSNGDTYQIEKVGGWSNIPLGIMEQQLGINQIGENSEDNRKINAFIKQQTSFGEEFKRKYTSKLPEQFYEDFDKAWRQKLKLEISNGETVLSHV